VLIIQICKWQGGAAKKHPDYSLYSSGGGLVYFRRMERTFEDKVYSCS
jgi:hypothetical protein